VIGIRGMGYPCSSDPWARCFSDMLVPALCPEHASQRALPLTGRLPSTVSATDTNSALFEASSVLCSHPTPHPRACPSYGCCLHGPVRCFGRTRVRSPRFRAKDVFHVHGVYDSARLLVRKPLRGEDVAFSSTERDRHLGIRPVSQLNNPAHSDPCETLRAEPRGYPSHHSGPGRLARPYPVKDLHLLSFASLSWRTLFRVTFTHPDARLTVSLRLQVLSS